MKNVNEELKKSVQKYFKKFDEDKYASLTIKNVFYTLLTTGQHCSISKRQSNYVLERERACDNDCDIMKDFRIRRLTPIECERLQGFPDDWTKYGKDNEPISDTQRYKCCGNAVTTNVITAIINEMFKEVIEDEND